MKPIFVLIVSLALSACTACAPPAAPPIAPTPAHTPMAPLHNDAVLISASVVRLFDDAHARELDVVMQPSVTPEEVEAVRQADLRARAALTTLGQQGQHMTLNAARAAVHNLQRTLAPLEDQ